MTNNTDFLPYKAYLREDENVQKPIELLADLLTRYWEARQQGQEIEFIRQFQLTYGATEEWAEIVVRELAEAPLSRVFFDLIYPFWNNYDRIMYECTECGRLWVQMEGNRFVSYLPETDTRHVLWSRHNHNPYGSSWE